MASSVTRRNPPVLRIDDDLSKAIEVYGVSGEVHLPVVDNAETMTILGVAHEHEVMLSYQRALNQARAEERGEG